MDSLLVSSPSSLNWPLLGAVMFRKLSMKSSNTPIASYKYQKVISNRVERHHNEKAKAHIIRLRVIGCCIFEREAFQQNIISASAPLFFGGDILSYVKFL